MIRIINLTLKAGGPLLIQRMQDWIQRHGVVIKLKLQLVS